MTTEIEDGYIHKLQELRGRERSLREKLNKVLGGALEALRAEPVFLECARERIEEALKMVRVQAFEEGGRFVVGSLHLCQGKELRVGEGSYDDQVVFQCKRWQGPAAVGWEDYARVSVGEAERLTSPKGLR